MPKRKVASAPEAPVPARARTGRRREAPARATTVRSPWSAQWTYTPENRSLATHASHLHRIIAPASARAHAGGLRLSVRAANKITAVCPSNMLRGLRAETRAGVAESSKLSQAVGKGPRMPGRLDRDLEHQITAELRPPRGHQRLASRSHEPPFERYGPSPKGCLSAHDARRGLGLSLGPVPARVEWKHRWRRCADATSSRRSKQMARDLPVAP